MFIENLKKKDVFSQGHIVTNIDRLWWPTYFWQVQNQIPTLEYVSKISNPNQLSVKTKLVREFSIYFNKFSLEELNKIDFKFKKLSIDLQTLRTLYSKRYIFSNETAKFVCTIRVSDESYWPNFTRDDILNFLNYLHDTFMNAKQIEFVYRNSSLDILFSLMYYLEK